jgi:hypothetical protein
MNPTPERSQRPADAAASYVLCQKFRKRAIGILRRAGDHVSEHTKVWEHKKDYDPERFTRARDYAGSAWQAPTGLRQVTPAGL